MTDPYATLGLKRDASADEIKKAYRSLAHKYHPDKKGGDEARFKEINEAYQILSDPEKKSRYDRFGDADAGRTGFGGFGGFGGRPGEAYQDIHFDFGGSGGGFENFFDMFGSGFGASRRRPEKGEDLQLTVNLGRSDLGKRKVYEFEAFSACEACGGTGAEGGTMKTCEECRGQGRVRQAVRTPLGTFAQVAICPRCNGSGNTAERTCRACTGAGRIKSKRTIEIHIPQRIEGRRLIAFPGEGNAGLEGVPAGDLLVTLRMK